VTVDGKEMPSLLMQTLVQFTKLVAKLLESLASRASLRHNLKAFRSGSPFKMRPHHPVEEVSKAANSAPFAMYIFRKPVSRLVANCSRVDENSHV